MHHEFSLDFGGAFRNVCYFQPARKGTGYGLRMSDGSESNQDSPTSKRTSGFKTLFEGFQRGNICDLCIVVSPSLCCM